MALSLKNKERNSSFKNPPMLIWLFCFFFFVIPALPIGLALISHSTQPQLETLESGLRPELTEEGKRVFADKEWLIEKYLIAAKKYQIPWEYLAAIHKIESNLSLSTSPDLNIEDIPMDQLKVGPMGFTIANWVGTGDESNFPVGSFHQAISNPEIIKKFNGVGIDGNSDGIADPYEIDDALHAAANKLKQDGMENGKIDEAIARYNRTMGYVDKVKKEAQEMASLVHFSPSLEQVPTGSIAAMIDEAFHQYENRTIRYVFGGNTYPNLDCSSWVQYMYKRHLGISIERVTFDQVKQGVHVPKDQLQPGDLVFFTTYAPGASHVGLYVGKGMMIHNASTGKDLRYDPIMSGYYGPRYVEGRRYTHGTVK